MGKIMFPKAELRGLSPSFSPIFAGKSLKKSEGRGLFWTVSRSFTMTSPNKKNSFWAIFRIVSDDFLSPLERMSTHITFLVDFVVISV